MLIRFNSFEDRRTVWNARFKHKEIIIVDNIISLAESFDTETTNNQRKLISNFQKGL